MRPLNETIPALDALKATLIMLNTGKERLALTKAVFKAITEKPVKTGRLRSSFNSRNNGRVSK